MVRAVRLCLVPFVAATTLVLIGPAPAHAALKCGENYTVSVVGAGSTARLHHVVRIKNCRSRAVRIKIVRGPLMTDFPCGTVSAGRVRTWEWSSGAIFGMYQGYRYC